MQCMFHSYPLFAGLKATIAFAWVDLYITHDLRCFGVCEKDSAGTTASAVALMRVHLQKSFCDSRSLQDKKAFAVC